MKRKLLVALLAMLFVVPSFVFAQGGSEAGDKEVEIRFSTI